MKKVRITLLLLVAALCTGLSAQAKFGFGPKVGVNINKFNISGDNLKESNRCGFTGGLTAEYTAPVIGIGADISLMYTHMTTKVEEETVHGNFFEIPLHVKYKLDIPAVSSIVSPYVFTGPSVAFKLSGAESYGDTKRTQWGWDLGLGVQLINHLQIGAGYTFGINNLARKVLADDGAVIGGGIKVKNNYWTVTAAWMF